MTRFDYPGIGESIYRETLPNGLHLSIIPKPGYSRCHAFLAVHYGGADRRFAVDNELRDTPAGVAHFLEHKMFDMPDEKNALTMLTDMGASANAFTAEDMTAYYFECTGHFYEALNILLDFVSTPYFTDASIDRERGIIAQEIRMYDDDPYDVVYNRLMSCLYDHHPVRDDIAGTVDSIEHINADLLYTCHELFYVPGNMSLCVVGDVDPEAVYRAACDHLPAGSGVRPQPDYGQPEKMFPASRRFERSMEVSTPLFYIGAKLSAPSGGTELLKYQLLCGTALNCLYGRSSPFYNRHYADGLINTEFFADARFVADTACLLFGGESRDPERVLALILEQARTAVEHGIETDYFQRCKKAAYGARIRALSSFGGLCEAMATADFKGYNCLDSFAIMESVGPEDVRAFIKEAFVPENFAMSLIRTLSNQEDNE